MALYCKEFLKKLPARPGIYKMINAKGRILYVGKARHLKKRIKNYFRSTSQLDAKTQSMMHQVHHIDVTITPTENEALLLESTLIKTLRPRYNVILKDDKSYPYLFLSADADFPRLQVYRGAQRVAGEYFGPYPNSRSVYETLELLQKIFKIRQCNDIFFKNRTRPCLQYQIKRCTAPCVNYIDSKHYQENVHYARLFLQGKSDNLIHILADKMEKMSADLAYEEAAKYRDQIFNLRKIQHIESGKAREKDLDIVALKQHENIFCIEVLTIRNRIWIGSHTYFPQVPEHANAEETLAAFLSQYYLNPERKKSWPHRIYVSQDFPDKTWLCSALSQAWGYKIVIDKPKRHEQIKWLATALTNAEHALHAHLANQSNYDDVLSAFQKIFNLVEVPRHFECFDVSHTQGEATVASCVVFGSEGPITEKYRRFLIKDIIRNDDYAAIKQAISRHYTYLKTEEKVLPDVLIIDGGKGQLAKAEEVFKELQISNVLLLAVAKGATRKPGFETIFVSGNQKPYSLGQNEKVLYLIQRIRDEAHRFAITGHRKQRSKIRNKSTLEEIVGIGPKKRAQLLRLFGGLQGILEANIQDFCKVPGINRELAQRIYDNLQQVHK